MKQEQGQVKRHEAVNGGYRLLTIDVPSIAPDVRPGQFVHARIPNSEDTLLRRPFSVYRTEGKALSILYKAVGKGTERLRGVAPGDAIDLLGPLGNGFPEPASGKEPVLVAGGYGMAALYMLAHNHPGAGTAYFGGRAAVDILCREAFEENGWTVVVATEDGSDGFKGRVTEPLIERLNAREASAPEPEFFACGPNGMLRAVGDLAMARGWTAWLSMDRHMGCGVGACLTCVQKIKTDDGGWIWARVCKEGPVFEARQVDWEQG